MIKNSREVIEMTKDEIALIKQVQTGNQNAFDEVFNVYYGKAYAIAYRILNCDADAKDAAQEAMLEVYKSIHTLKEPSYFYAWLIRIVVSKCNRITRKNKSILMDPQTIQSVQAYEEKRPYMIPQHQTENQIEHEILIGLIYSLKPQMAEVLDLMYIQQMKLHEIAEYMNIPMNTVKTRVVRGRNLLKEQIKQYEAMEGRKLKFHLNLPISIFGFALLVETIKNQASHVVTSITQYASGGAAQMACVVSFSVLTVTGTVFAVEDYQEYKQAQQHHTNKQAQTQKDIQEPQNKPSKQEQPQEQVSYENTFEPAQFGNEAVTTSLDAYYTCINWAYDKEEMKERTIEEINEIFPTYIALKTKQDAYWDKLVHKGWNVSFEALLDRHSIAY